MSGKPMPGFFEDVIVEGCAGSSSKKLRSSCVEVGGDAA